MNIKRIILLLATLSTFSFSIFFSYSYADGSINPNMIKSSSESNMLIVKQGSTLIFNIKKLSDIFGYNLVVNGTNDIEILRDSKIALSNYQNSLSTLIKGYPVHIDLYQANHVAVVSILASQS